MPIDTSQIMMMVEPGNNRVWIECDAFVEYLRMVERKGHATLAAHGDPPDPKMYAVLMAIQDTVRQIADSLVVTAMSAQDTAMRGSHGS